MDTVRIDNRILRLVRGDITDLDIESFVFYARHDLNLGSGYGGAVSVRGGPTIQEQLKEMGPLETTEVAVSDAGDLKADYIIHAVGPRFQEENIEEKLRATIINCLKAADEKGIKKIAFPPMGTGFYGIPLDVSARVTTETIKGYLAGDTSLEEVHICVQDNREQAPFETYFTSREPV
jgi:O-acetyl-ADP-ribose deacetylase (regulator of RNase III)